MSNYLEVEANQSRMPFKNDRYRHVTEKQINEARLKHAQGNDCPMCSIFGTKGYIENGDVWVRCFSCNPTKSERAAENKSLTLTKENQARYLEFPHTCPFCRSDELDATSSSLAESGEIHQPVVCFGCGRKWTDVYLLSRIEGIESGEN